MAAALSALCQMPPQRNRLDAFVAIKEVVIFRLGLAIGGWHHSWICGWHHSWPSCYQGSRDFPSGASNWWVAPFLDLWVAPFLDSS